LARNVSQQRCGFACLFSLPYRCPGIRAWLVTCGAAAQPMCSCHALASWLGFARANVHHLWSGVLSHDARDCSAPKNSLESASGGWESRVGVPEWIVTRTSILLAMSQQFCQRTVAGWGWSPARASGHIAICVQRGESVPVGRFEFDTRGAPPLFRFHGWNSQVWMLTLVSADWHLNDMVEHPIRPGETFSCLILKRRLVSVPPPLARPPYQCPSKPSVLVQHVCSHTESRNPRPTEVISPQTTQNLEMMVVGQRLGGCLWDYHPFSVTGRWAAWPGVQAVAVTASNDCYPSIFWLSSWTGISGNPTRSRLWKWVLRPLFFLYFHLLPYRCPGMLSMFAIRYTSYGVHA